MLYFEKIMPVLMSAAAEADDYEDGPPSWGALIFTLAFISFILWLLIDEDKSLRRRFSVPVEAVCVDYFPYGFSHELVWEYEYEGRIITSAEVVKGIFKKKELGQVKVLYINPDDPENFCRFRKNSITMVCTVIFFVALTVGLIIFKLSDSIG